MKRFLIVILLVISILTINACSFDGEPDPTEPKHVHDYKNKRVVAPTCVNDGYTLLICDCGDLMRTAYVPKNGHAFTNAKVVLPTADEKEHIERTCHCGEVSKDFETPLYFNITQDKKGYLYYYYVNSRLKSESLLLVDEPVVKDHYTEDRAHIFFVKEAERNKLYGIARNDLSQQKLLYEAANGQIDHIAAVEREGFVSFTEGHERCVLLNLNTGESQVIFEGIYLEWAFPYFDETGKLRRIIFSGQPTENYKKYTYFYYPDTGEFQEHNG